MKSKPLVSIIIPTHGRNNLFEKTLISAMEQDYKKIEIIVIDDNDFGNENSKTVIDILNKYKKENIYYIKSEKNLGGAEARNLGYKLSKGDYIAFLDDDDEFLKNKISYVMENRFDSEKKEVDMIYTYCYIENLINKTKKIFKNPLTDIVIYQHMLENICATSQLVVKKNILEKINGFENVSSKQDYLLILKIIGLGAKIKCIEEPLSIYKEHDFGRISTASLKKIRAEKFALKFSKKYFGNLTEKQIREIKFMFYKRMFDLSFILKDRKRKKYFVYKMFKNLIIKNKYILILLKCNIKTYLRT